MQFHSKFNGSSLLFQLSPCSFLGLHIFTSYALWRWLIFGSFYAWFPVLGTWVGPVCRVKRFANRAFRASPLVAKASSVPVNPHVCPPTCGRWDHGALSLACRPQEGGLLRMGGLAPPPRAPPAAPSGSLKVGGLQFCPRPLAVYSPGMQHITLAGCVPQVPRSPTFHPPMMGTSVQAGISDLVSAVIPTGSSAMSMSHMHDHLKAQHLRQWLLILDSASSASSLFVSTLHSEFAESHRIKAVEHYAPSTLAAYIRMWHQWDAFAACHNQSPYSPPVSLLGDFLHVHSRTSSQGLASGYIRSLAWVAKRAGFPALSEALQEPVARAYAVASHPRPRCEAAPLPLSFIIWLESCILSSIGTPADRLIMGGILVLVWGSLRWSDSQWVSPADLLEDMDSLRGMALRTKATTRGMPFGILRSGFLGHTVNSPWSTLWLNLVREALHLTAARHRGFKPDFLIPQIGTDL